MPKRIVMKADTSGAGQHQLYDSSTGKKLTLAGAAASYTGADPDSLVYVENRSDGDVWVRWDGSAAAPPSAGASVACPSWPLTAGTNFHFPPHTDGTLSLYGTGDVFCMATRVN
jgi:hypothetical protein